MCVVTLLWRVIQLVSLCNAGSELAASIIERHLILKVVAFGSLDVPSQAQRSRAFAAKASHQEPAVARGRAGCGAKGCYQRYAYDCGVCCRGSYYWCSSDTFSLSAPKLDEMVFSSTCAVPGYRERSQTAKPRNLHRSSFFFFFLPHLQQSVGLFIKHIV